MLCGWTRVKRMNKKDYIAPTVFGIIFLAISIFIPFSEANTFSGEIFTFSSLLFGLIFILLYAIWSYSSYEKRL